MWTGGDRGNQRDFVQFSGRHGNQKSIVLKRGYIKILKIVSLAICYFQVAFIRAIENDSYPDRERLPIKFKAACGEGKLSIPSWLRGTQKKTPAWRNNCQAVRTNKIVLSAVLEI